LLVELIQQSKNMTHLVCAERMKKKSNKTKINKKLNW